jgi:hypothetical protein
VKPHMKAAYERLDAMGEEPIMEARASGMSVRKMQAKFEVSVRQLYGWLGKIEKNRKAEIDGVCRRERWNEATAMGAETKAALADERLEVLIDPETGRMLPSVSREEVALAKALAEQERWSAGNMDPAIFRPNQVQNQPTTQLNIGQLFLQALQAPVVPTRTLPAPASAAPIEDAEFEDIDDNPLALDD